MRRGKREGKEEREKAKACGTENVMGPVFVFVCICLYLFVFVHFDSLRLQSKSECMRGRWTDKH